MFDDRKPDSLDRLRGRLHPAWRWRSRWLCLASVTLLLVSWSVAAWGQSSVQTVRQRWAELLKLEPQLLAPKRYREARSAMEDLEHAIRRERSTENLVEKATERLVVLDEALDLAHETWRDLLELRARALASDASRLATATFQQADNILLSAAKKLETGRIDAAQRQVQGAGAIYTKAWQEAVRAQLVGESRRLLAEAEQRGATQFAPRSYVRALDQVKEVEKMMQDLPQDDPKLLAASQKASDLVTHHLFLLDLLQATCEETTRPKLESEIVSWEDALSRSLFLLDLESSYELGMKAPLQRVEREIDVLQQERLELRRRLRRSEAQADSLQRVVDMLKENVQDFEGRVAHLSQFESEANVVHKIQRRFSQSEGRVLVENRDLILRLHGLRFASGESEIPIDALTLLDKVVQSVNDLPNSFLIVEGHTDSKGREDKNKTLSKQRADAVRDYLVESGAIDLSRVTTIGYGSSRPVATNDTEEGRALNRRIEITISRTGP